jgi:hypothetical protein
MSELQLAKKIIKEAYVKNIGGLIIIPSQYLTDFYDIPGPIRAQAQLEVLAEEEPKWLQHPL